MRSRQIAVSAAVVLFACLSYPVSPLLAQMSNPPANFNFNDLPDCAPAAQSGYRTLDKSDKKRKNWCRVLVKRGEPTIPYAISVPQGTEVFIKLEDPRPNETVTFALTETKTPPTDVLAAAVKNLAPGLQAITIFQPVTPRLSPRMPLFEAAPPSKRIDRYKEIATKQQGLVDQLAKVANAQSVFNAISGCLSSYQIASPQLPESDKVFTNSDAEADGKLLTDLDTSRSCSQNEMLNGATFKEQKSRTVNFGKQVGAIPLPLFSQAALDKEVRGYYDECIKIKVAIPINDGKPYSCSWLSDRLASQQALIDSQFGDLAKAQDTILQTTQQISQISDSKPDVIYDFKVERQTNFVVTITGVEAVSKASTTISTVTINQTTTHWVVSTGLSFSNLKSNIFSITPLLNSDGTVQKDPNGNTLSTITQSGSDFSLIAPLGMVHYRPDFVNKRGWRCRGGCYLVLGAGLGANLSTKSADFDTGPGFQWGGVIFSPTVHFGRDTRLIQGFKVGQSLGANAPSALPTGTSWVTKWGFAITYSIPIT
jgi:hypothetical protein